MISAREAQVSSVSSSASSVAAAARQPAASSAFTKRTRKDSSSSNSHGNSKQKDGHRSRRYAAASWGQPSNCTFTITRRTSPVAWLTASLGPPLPHQHCFWAAAGFRGLMAGFFGAMASAALPPTPRRSASIRRTRPCGRSFQCRRCGLLVADKIIPPIAEEGVEG